MASIDTKRRVGNDLTEGNVLRQLIKYIIPMLLANIVHELYNTVDMIVIGQYVGTIGTVGVSVGGEIAGITAFLAMGIGSASQIYVAQLYGAKNHKAISEMLSTAVIMSIVTSLVCAAAAIIFCDPFLKMLNCPVEAYEQAKDYMCIMALGLPFVFGYITITSILRGMGESKRPLLFVVIAAIANIFLDILLVAVIPLEAAGTAIATVASQFASFAAAAIFLYKKRESLGIEISMKGLRIRKNHMKIIVRLAIPLAAQTALIHVTLLICSSFINSYGLVASGTNSVGNKVQRFINVFGSSVSHGAGAMVGQNIAAGKHERVKKIVYTVLTLSLALSLVSCALCLIFPRQLYGVFSNDAEVIEFGVTYLQIACISLILQAFMGSYQSVINGSGHVKLGFAIGVLDGVILRLGISFSFAYLLDMGVLGFFYGNALGRLGPIIIGMWYFYSNKWRTRKLLSDEANEH